MRRLLWLAFFLTSCAYADTIVYSTITVTGSYQVPSDVSQITIECIGGGGGGIPTSAKATGGGGSGGLYASTGPITVTPLTTYAVKIGTAGAAGISGGPTIFGSSICWAAGGNTGVTTTGGTPAAATTSTGTIKYIGGYGENSGASNGGGGGGSGGRGGAGNYTSAGGTSATAGAAIDANGPGGPGGTGNSAGGGGSAPGSGYGGGGGGARYTTGVNVVGGAGYAGVVIVKEVHTPTSAVRRRVLVVQ